MATKNTSSMFERISVIVVCFLLGACAQTQRRSESARIPVIAGAQKSSQSQDTFDGDDIAIEAGKATPPVKAADAVPKVAIILGPGGYRTFAHATILKEFAKARIPIEKVIGVEWGALAGAFYAMDGRAHEAEWKLYKLDAKSLESQGFFSRKNEPQSVKALQKYLSENIGSRDLAKLRVKFSCPSLSLQNGTVSFFERGSATIALEMCLSYPPHWTPSRGAVAGALSVTEAAERLKREGYNVVILVNVLGNESIPLGRDDFGGQVLWNEVRRNIWMAKSRVTDVVEVDMKGIGLYDFEARKSITQAAERAAQSAVRTLTDKYGF